MTSVSRELWLADEDYLFECLHSTIFSVWGTVGHGALSEELEFSVSTHDIIDWPSFRELPVIWDFNKPPSARKNQKLPVPLLTATRERLQIDPIVIDFHEIKLAPLTDPLFDIEQIVDVSLMEMESSSDLEFDLQQPPLTLPNPMHSFDEPLVSLLPISVQELDLSCFESVFSSPNSSPHLQDIASFLEGDQINDYNLDMDAAPKLDLVKNAYLDLPLMPSSKELKDLSLDIINEDIHAVEYSVDLSELPLFPDCHVDQLIFESEKMGSKYHKKLPNVSYTSSNPILVYDVLISLHMDKYPTGNEFVLSWNPLRGSANARIIDLFEDSCDTLVDWSAPPCHEYRDIDQEENEEILVSIFHDSEKVLEIEGEKSIEDDLAVYMHLRGKKLAEPARTLKKPKLELENPHPLFVYAPPPLPVDRPSVKVIAAMELSYDKEMVELFESNYIKLIYRNLEIVDVIPSPRHAVLIRPLIATSQTGPGNIKDEIDQVLQCGYSHVLVIGVAASEPFKLTQPIAEGLIANCYNAKFQLALSRSHAVALIRNIVDATVTGDIADLLVEDETIHENYLVSTGCFNPYCARVALTKLSLAELMKLSARDLAEYLGDSESAETFHALINSEIPQY